MKENYRRCGFSRRKTANRCRPSLGSREPESCSVDHGWRIGRTSAVADRLGKPTGRPRALSPASDGHQPTDALQIEPGDDPWLVADVGGTHARIGVYQPTLGLQQPMRFANDLFPSMPALFDEYRRRTSLSASRMLLAIALPETSLTLKMTNRAWHVDPHELRQQSRLRQLYVVNDFAAAVAAVPRLGDAQLQTVQPGTTESSGPIVLLGPGTGLGVAAALRIDDRWCVCLARLDT